MNVNNGTFNQDGSITSTGDPSNPGAGGTINILSTGTLTIPSIANISVNSTNANATGGTINVNATGALSIANGTLNANGQGTGNETGGQITVSGSSVNIATGGPLHIERRRRRHWQRWSGECHCNRRHR